MACDFAHAQLPAQHYAHAQIYIFGRGGGHWLGSNTRCVDLAILLEKLPASTL